jgi:NADH-quinone oxidoreductase subunit J
MELFLVYLFGWLMLVSAFVVIHATNPVHSVISLVMVFFNAAGILFVFGLEYLALVLIIVYVGAIAVLFLFVVMMLNIKKSQGIFWGRWFALFSVILIALLGGGFGWQYVVQVLDFPSYSYIVWPQLLNHITDLEVIGQALFTYYWLYVILAGFVLLVAMVGSIVLTMVHSKFVKRQNIYVQTARTVYDSVGLKNIQK